MRGKPTEQCERGRRSGCPVNVALEIFGDRWSLIVIRDLMFKNRSTYKEMLAAEEGIATNILADRLARLEAAGIIDRTPDPADRRCCRYRLTPKGVDLAPVLVEMIIWAANHEATAAPADLVRSMERNRAEFIERIRHRLAGAAAEPALASDAPPPSPGRPAARRTGSPRKPRRRTTGR